MEKARREIRLVPLQVADEVPAGPLADRRDFVPGLLNPVLAEIGDSGGDRLPHPCGRHGLAHPDERDLRRCSAAALCGRSDPPSDRVQIQRNTTRHRK